MVKMSRQQRTLLNYVAARIPMLAIDLKAEFPYAQRSLDKLIELGLIVMISNRVQATELGKVYADAYQHRWFLKRALVDTSNLTMLHYCVEFAAQMVNKPVPLNMPSEERRKIYQIRTFVTTARKLLNMVEAEGNKKSA